MKWEEKLFYERLDGRIEGKIESLLECLEELGDIPNDLHNRISNELDMEQIKKWTKLVMNVDSMEEFIKKM